jgi:Alkali metal cation/H+ antiporter Nha1 C terminus
MTRTMCTAIATLFLATLPVTLSAQQSPTPPAEVPQTAPPATQDEAQDDWAIGEQNLRKHEVAQAIEKRRAKLAKAAELTAASVLADLKTVLERCLQVEPVLNSDGEETGEFRFNPGGALKAIELQGKFLGMWDGSLARQSEEETEETPAERERRNHALGEVVQLFNEKRLEL